MIWSKWVSILYTSDSACVLLLSHLCGSSEKDEFRRSQTPAVPVPEGPPSCWPGDGRHAARFCLPTTCGHEGTQAPGRLPRVLHEESLCQQEETPPWWQPAGRHRQCDHLPQPGRAATRELRSWQEKSAVSTNKICLFFSPFFDR